MTSAAVKPAAAEPAAEQKRLSSVGIKIGSRRRVVDLDIARRLQMVPAPLTPHDCAGGPLGAAAAIGAPMIATAAAAAPNNGVI